MFIIIIYLKNITKSLRFFSFYWFNGRSKTNAPNLHIVYWNVKAIKAIWLNNISPIYWL